MVKVRFDFPSSKEDLNGFTDKQAYKYAEDALQAMERLHIISSQKAVLTRRVLEESKSLKQDTGINRGGKNKERFSILILRTVLWYWEGMTDLLSYRV